MTSWTARVLALLAGVLLAGCNLQLDLDGPPVSRWPLDLYFADPKAQQLAAAAEAGDVTEVRRLMKVEGVDPDRIFANERMYRMPLIAWPVFTRSPEGLRAMLENGADPNVSLPHPQQHTQRFKGRRINNAMVYAAKAEDPVYLRLLLEHGGDPNTRNSNGETLMLQAFLMGNQWENVKLLVEHGADVNATSQGTPIITNYARMGHFDAVHWLLEKGADPQLTEGPSSAVDDIYWFPLADDDPALPYQRKCQQWLQARGIARPPMPDFFRRMRERLGYPTDEASIPIG